MTKAQKSKCEPGINSIEIHEIFLKSCSFGILENVEKLIADGIDINTKTRDTFDGVEYGDNGLMLAITGFGTAVMNNEPVDKFVKIITLLLESGIDVYVINSMGLSVEYMLESLAVLGSRIQRIRKLVTKYYHKTEDGRVIKPYMIVMTTAIKERYDNTRIHYCANRYIKDEENDKHLRFLLLILLEGKSEHIQNYFSNQSNTRPTLSDLQKMLSAITPDDYVSRNQIAGGVEEVYDCYARRCIKYWISNLSKKEKSEKLNTPS